MVGKLMGEHTQIVVHTAKTISCVLVKIAWDILSLVSLILVLILKSVETYILVVGLVETGV